jgi:hypothetical protein
VNAEVLDSEMFGGAAGAYAFIGSVLQASTEYSIIATDQHGVISLWNEGGRRSRGVGVIGRIPLERTESCVRACCGCGADREGGWRAGG